MARYLQLRPSDESLLFSLRDRDLAVSHEGGCLWVRVDQWNAVTEAALKGLPCVGQYTRNDRGQLTPIGGQLAELPAPRGPFTALKDAYAPMRPYPALTGETPAIVGAALERSSKERPVAAVACPLVELEAYAGRTLTARLQQLTFAAASDGTALVVGAPPPSLPGQGYWRDHGVLIPLGWAFPMACYAELLTVRLRLQANDVARWTLENDCEIIAGHLFQPLSRSAIRRTLEALP